MKIGDKDIGIGKLIRRKSVAVTAIIHGTLIGKSLSELQGLAG
jgi:hypothetical protein